MVGSPSISAPFSCLLGTTLLNVGMTSTPQSTDSRETPAGPGPGPFPRKIQALRKRGLLSF